MFTPNCVCYVLWQCFCLPSQPLFKCYAVVTSNESVLSATISAVFHTSCFLHFYIILIVKLYDMYQKFPVRVPYLHFEETVNLVVKNF